MDSTTILQRATELFHRSPPWCEFFRQVLGVEGLISELTPEARYEFEGSAEFAQIHRMLYRLRQRSDNDKQPQRVITVRLPAPLHESLRHEAHDKHTSMNKLCISKLLQPVADDLVPNDTPPKQPASNPEIDGPT